MKKFLLTMLLASFLVSCDFLWDIFRDEDTPLEPDQFYAVNFTNNSFYKVRAEIKAQGEKCVIWAEKGSGVTEAKAQEIADKYDNEIRKKIVDAFGMKNFTVKDGASQHQFDDILDYANWLVGKNNKKLTILLLDIKDNFNDPKNLSFVAGYFYSGNFLPREQRKSNGCDMIFVDTYPGLSDKYPKQKPKTYATFAHELQHLINFSTTTVLKRERAMDTWIDEGLSSQAEQIYYEGTILADIFDGNIKEHYDWFNNDKCKTIAKGNNFFVWDNHPEETMAILDEYSTVYLFFRWLYLQAQAKGLQSNIFLNIETSKLSDHTVITNAAKDINSEWANWDKLLSSWLAANYYPTNSNYGYKDNYFKDLKVKPLTATSTPLYPGEGVYSSIKNPITPQSGGTNIRYARLPDSTSGIATQTPFNSGVLLTYNANTNNKAKAETGTLTGVAASVSSPSNSRMIIDAEQTPTGPYRIDARDISGILGRNK
jgi:hypothetical protein